MKYCILILLLFCFGSAFSQLQNDSLAHRIRPDSLKSGSLYVDIYNFNFLRNYEFYNKIQDGYTLYGTQIEPQLVYYVNPQLAITAGANIRKDFGGNGINKAYPLFSLKYNKNAFTLVNGYLEGNIHHRFIEPLFDFENKINNPVEYGTQFLIEEKRLFIDAFINWKRMIYKPSPQQEQIFAGASSETVILRKQHFNLSLPLQATIFHQGGQIDTVGKPLQTLLNSAAGIKLKLSPTGNLKNVEASAYLVTFNELSPTKVLAFSKATGYYLNAGAAFNFGTIAVSYWNANGFISPAGMPLFQSVSQQINHEGYSQKKRELLFIRYAYQKQLVPHLFMDFRVEPVMDLNLPNKKFELYHSLFFVYKQQFKILGKKSNL